MWRSTATAAGPELATSAPLGCFIAATQVAVARDSLTEKCSAAAYSGLQLHRQGRPQWVVEAAVAASCSS